MTPTWNANKVNIVNQIRDKWQMKEIFGEEEIERIEGILDVNTLEIGTNPNARGFYPITSFASHDCINNTIRSLNSTSGALQTRAKIDIAGNRDSRSFYLGISSPLTHLAGEEITLHYAGGLKGRLTRRALLAEGWFFGCQCKR